MKLFGFFHLRSIGGQIAALVVASIIALHLILTLSFVVSRPDRAEPPPDSAHHLADAAQLLGSASASERPRLMSDIARAFPALGIDSSPLARPRQSRTLKAITCTACAGISATVTR